MSDLSIHQILSQMRALQAQAGVAQPQAPVEQKQFADLLRQSIDKVAENQNLASELASSFSRGEPEADLTSVMISMQKARISFEAMTEVRNKLVEAYNEIRQMPI